MANLFSEAQARIAWQKIAARAVKEAFDGAAFTRIDEWLRRWESYFDGARWEVWQNGGERIGAAMGDYEWSSLSFIDNLRGDLLEMGRSRFQRARALLHLGRCRGTESNDANCFSIPGWFEAFIDDDSAKHSDAIVDRAYEWLRQRALDAYYGFGDTQWMRRWHCVKAAICVALGLHGPPKGKYGDGLKEHVRRYDDTVDCMAVWDDGVGYFEPEPYGTTLEVGAGVFRNWWFEFGSL